MPEKDTKSLPDDALAYLPRSDTQEFAKGGQIYGPGESTGNLYLVIEGRVKVCRTNQWGVTVVVDIYQPDDFFGESALLNTPREGEEATSLEATKVMTWSAADIETLIEAEPRLAVALMQVVVKRCSDFKNRLESFSLESTSHRLGRALLNFAERLGSASEDGAITIAPLTHELLAQYVGTSREIVSHQMSEFRSRGYIRYSRKGITIQDGLRTWLFAKEDHA